MKKKNKVKYVRRRVGFSLELTERVWKSDETTWGRDEARWLMYYLMSREFREGADSFARTHSDYEPPVYTKARELFHEINGSRIEEAQEDTDADADLEAAAAEEELVAEADASESTSRA